MRARFAKPLLPAAVVAASLALAASALAVVEVYDNKIDSAAQMRELKQSGGGKKRCDRSYGRRNKNMRVRVQSEGLCTYRPPVEGDADAPDFQARLVGKVIKGAGSKAARKKAYLVLGVRVGANRGYVLEVRPRGKRFELTRQPGGSSVFPIAGTEERIGALGKRNILKLRAFGNRIVATVNGAKVASVTDPNASEVSGRRVFFGVGSGTSAGTGPAAAFEQISVFVPDP